MTQTLLLALDLDEAADSAQRSAQLALTAESAGFHAVSFAQGLIDPVQRAAFAAARTHRIGLIAQLDALFTEPFHTATQLASLDSLSFGRAGWYLRAENLAEHAAAVGREPLPVAELGLEAADVVTAHRRLWDSWEDDAVIRDVDSGRYLDADKLHYADVQGQRFSIKGPSITPRPPQGQLPIIAPAALFTDPGLRHCRLEGADAVAVSATQIDTLLHQATAASQGGAVAVELEVFLDHAGRSGEQRAASVPPSDRARFAGSATQLVQLLQQIAQATANPADQRRHIVHLHPGQLSIDLEELAARVLPQARKAELLAPTEFSTLRETLALPIARNRFQEAA